MFANSGKMGRGGGGGAAKRNLHAPPINRTGRPSMGGGPRGRGGAPSSSPSTSSMQVEESFSLVRENPLSFGMAIKLAPDLVEEIKRVEAQGGGARIKFDVNANNPNGNFLFIYEDPTPATREKDLLIPPCIFKTSFFHDQGLETVIHVGDKVFRFTWSREPGDLCDVYEERQTGEDGNGLLVESGGTWRKLNVERELDESTKNHVKRRSEEAERKHKSRKAIVLDHQNPSMKNQVKAVASAESNPWRNFKNRKEPPFKKAKLDPPSGGPLAKPAYITGLSTTPLSKAKISSGSPLSSQPDQHSGPVSPFGSGNLVKGHGDITDVAPTQNTNKLASSDKEMHSRLPHSTIREKSKHKRKTEANPADMKSLVISLLQEHHPKGMSLKALEKATGDVMPNSARQIEPILKQVAIYQTPGKYLLKSAVEKDRLNKAPSQSGSSPEVNHHQLPSPQTVPQPTAQESSFPTKTRTPPNGEEEEEQGELNSPLLHTTDITEKIDILQNSQPQQQFSDRKASENSEGRASSSSDSGSDSDSSSSDSDSESHSQSKSQSPVGSSSDSEASISSKQASDEEVDIMSDDDKDSKHKLLDSVQWSHPDDEYVDIGTYEKQDDLVATDVVEIEKDSPEDLLFTNHNEGEGHVEERESGARKTRDRSESVAVNDSFPKVKSKRHRDDKRSDDRKRSKSKNLSQPVFGTISSLFGDSPDHSTPDRPLQGPEIGAVNEMEDRNTRDDNNQTRVSNEAPSVDKKPVKHDSLDHGAKYSERILQSNEGPWVQKGLNMEAHGEDGLVSEKRPVRFSSEGAGDKHMRKPETLGKIKETGLHSNSRMGSSTKENNASSTATDRLPVANGRGSVLRREYSDLELGELREPIHDVVTPLPKKKKIERNSDSSRGKPPNNKITTDSGVKLSQQVLEAVVSSVPDVSSKKASEKSTRPLDHIEAGYQHNKVLETTSKSRFADAGPVQARSSEGSYADVSRRMSVNSTEQLHDPFRGGGAQTTKGSKKQKPSIIGDSNSRRIDASLTGSNDGGQKKKESSSDEKSCLYTKYEKEEPELKGPINDASRYIEYVKEYQEKFEIYSSLKKILESYRDEFSKLGKDLEDCKGTDMKRYHDTKQQIRTSFYQCGERHKRQKKIFVILHEELQHLKQMLKDYAASYERA